MSNLRTLNRREFMRIFAAGAVGLSLGGCQGGITKRAVEQQNQPNIVFIIADDMGWKDIGYHGSEIQTPTLDRLANEGRVFDQHYVMPTCTPTRVDLLSGHCTSSARMRQNCHKIRRRFQLRFQ